MSNKMRREEAAMIKVIFLWQDDVCERLSCSQPGPISAMFTCQPIICALITCILSTAALLKLCHNKTVFTQKSAHGHTHAHTLDRNRWFVFNWKMKTRGI